MKKMNNPLPPGEARSRVPVLLLGGGVTPLGAGRSLGPLGIPVYATCDAADLAARSRWIMSLNGGLPEFSSAEQLGAFLLDAPFDRLVLMPCSDTWSETVASLPAVLAERFPSFIAPLPVLRRLTDKEQFGSLVREHGIPHPRTFDVHAPEDLDRYELAPDAQFFLKARNSQQFIARTGVKAYMVGSVDEARRKVAELAGAGLGVVLQEYVPGPPTHHYFVDGFADAEGRVVARFARQRLRMHPPHFGNSTYLRSIALGDVSDIVTTVDRLIQVSGLRGIFSVELKRDAKTGVAKVLEVNARPWWYVHFATACGVNVCEMAYRTAIGQPLQPGDGSAYAVGRTCAYVRPDYRACRELRREGRLSLLSCVGPWLWSEHMIFAADDPMPFVHRCFGEAAASLRRPWPRI
jgi:predicted ATP-grasp superfamily ATP-dependent carboligase